MTGATSAARVRVLVVDDEAPQRSEIVYLLGQMSAVESVADVANAEEALRALDNAPFDVVLLDVGLPGLNGIELARVLVRFADPPALVFVTAHEEHAVEAFELRAVDYLLKPLRAERLEAAINRAATGRARSPGDGHPPPPAEAQTNLDRLPVEAAGRTRFISRNEVRLVESCGDYSRLHTDSGQYLVRTPLTSLETAWRAHGFLRVHRSYLVAVPAIEQIMAEPGGGYAVKVAGRRVPVSRRHTRTFRERVLRSPDGPALG